MAQLATKYTTLLFPGFYLQTLRRKPRTARQLLTEKLALIKQKTFSQLGEFLGKFISSTAQLPTNYGENSRRRIYSK